MVSNNIRRKNSYFFDKNYSIAMSFIVCHYLVAVKKIELFFSGPMTLPRLHSLPFRSCPDMHGNQTSGTQRLSQTPNKDRSLGPCAPPPAWAGWAL